MGNNWTGLTGAPYAAVYQRVPVQVDEHHKILTWGLSNLYPQEAEQIRLASALTKSSTEVLEDFLNGMGFEQNNEEVVNRFGETTQDILNLIAKDAARFSGAFGLHLNFDGSGAIIEIQRLPVEYIRLKLSRRADGRVTHVAVSDNWEDGNTKPPLKPKTYPLFNPLTAAEETIKGGRGQVLFFTGVVNGMYPLATYDAIIDTSVTDANIAKWERNNVSKGFHGAVFFKYPAPINSKSEEAEIKKKVDSALGVESPGAQVVSVDEEFTADLVETVEGLNVDDIFTVTLASVEARTLSTFRIPPPLLGINPEGGVFTQLAYFEAYTVYNITSRNGRKAIARAFNKVTQLMGFEVGGIIENSLGVIPNFGNNGG